MGHSGHVEFVGGGGKFRFGRLFIEDVALVVSAGVGGGVRGGKGKWEGVEVGFVGGGGKFSFGRLFIVDWVALIVSTGEEG